MEVDACMHFQCIEYTNPYQVTANNVGLSEQVQVLSGHSMALMPKTIENINGFYRVLTPKLL